MLQLDLPDLRSQSTIHVQCPFDALADLPVESLGEMFRADPDPQVLQRLIELLAVVGDRFIDTGPVSGVVTGEHFQQQGG